MASKNNYQQESEKNYSAPMPWIGVYVAVASLVCTLAMAADVFHGFRHKKLWFPCKYFTLNAASLTLIAIAMKLPVDLNNPMPRAVDQSAKISSSAFMCIMMANFMPSLGPMNSNDLIMNITALGILVITIIVNVSIQLSTGVIIGFFSLLHLTYIIFMLYLLILLTSTALIVPISKKILQYKYLEMLKINLMEESIDTRGSCTADKLIYDVSKYWIMAETSNPQFVLACSPTSAASGAICFLAAFFLQAFLPAYKDDRSLFPSVGESDYRWSVFPIIAIQSIGVVVGTIAPFFRLFRAFSFKLSLNQSKKYLKFYHIEKYWTQTLVDWKSKSISLKFGGRKCQKFIHEFKNLTLNSLIGIQIFIVIVSKITLLIIIFLVVIFSNCWYCFTWMVCICASKSPEGLESEHHDNAMPELSRYVLQLEDEVEIANKTLARISKAVLQLIKKAEKRQPSNLMKLLEKSTGFKGVAKFDSSQVPPLLSSRHPNSWSLVLTTLTSIVIALQTGKKGTSDCLLSGINEGMQLVSLIEESLDPNDENMLNVRKTASYVWLQVEIYNKWMDLDLQEKALRGKTSMDILNWLGDKAQMILVEYTNSMYVGPADSSFLKVIAANSMFRISQSIILDHKGTEGQADEMLFDELLVMIADIMSACLSNIQRVIAKKCEANDIEKREANVKIAAQLVGQTKEIMKFPEQREIPSLDPNKLGYIDEWHTFLNNQIP